MSRSLAACLALLALCACATESAATANPPPAARTASTAGASAKPAPKRPVICENDAPVGTHFTTRRCRNAEQSDQERARLQEELLRARSTPGLLGN